MGETNETFETAKLNYCCKPVSYSMCLKQAETKETEVTEQAQIPPKLVRQFYYSL